MLIVGTSTPYTNGGPPDRHPHHPPPSRGTRYGRAPRPELNADTAAEAYDELLRDRPAAGWAGLAADAWSAAGDPARALDRVRQGLALPGLMQDERATLIEIEVRIRLDAGDLLGADAALVALAEVAPRGAGDDQVRALLADPEAGPVAARALSRRDWSEQRDAAIALYALRPDDPVARRLYAQRVLALPSGTWDIRLSRARAADLAEALEIAADPTTCDELDDALVAAGFTAARLGATDLAARTADRIARSCTRPRTVAQAARIEARARFVAPALGSGAASGAPR